MCILYPIKKKASLCPQSNYNYLTLFHSFPAFLKVSLLLVMMEPKVPGINSIKSSQRETPSRSKKQEINLSISSIILHFLKIDL